MKPEFNDSSEIKYGIVSFIFTSETIDFGDNTPMEPIFFEKFQI